MGKAPSGPDQNDNGNLEKSMNPKDSEIPKGVLTDIERIVRGPQIENSRLARGALDRHPNLIPMALGFPNIFTLLIPPRSVPGYPPIWHSQTPSPEKAWKRYYTIHRHDKNRQVSIRKPSFGNKGENNIRFTLKTVKELKTRKAKLSKNADLEERLIFHLTDKMGEFLPFTKENLAKGFFSEEIFKNYPKNKLFKIMTSVPSLRKSHRLKVQNNKNKNISLYFHRNNLENFLSDKILKQILSLPLDHIPKNLAEWLLIAKNSESRNQKNISQKEFPIFLKLYQKAIQEIRRMESQKAEEETFKNNIKETQKGFRVLIEERAHVFQELYKLINYDWSLCFFKDFPQKEIYKLNQKRAEIEAKSLDYSVKQLKDLKNKWSIQSPNLERASADTFLYFIRGKNEHQKAKINEKTNWPNILPEKFRINGIAVEPILNIDKIRRHGQQMLHCVGSYSRRCVEENPTHIVECITPLGIRGTVALFEDEKARTISASEYRGFKNSPIDSQIEKIIPEIEKAMNQSIRDSSYPQEKNKNKRYLILDYIIRSNMNQMTPKMFRYYCARRWQIWRRILPELPELPDAFFSKTHIRPMALLGNNN